jgi:hypothetical protein
MFTSDISYRCEGFYPLKASNMTHAAMLFAVWKARQKYGPNAKCSKLAMQGNLQPDRATFEAFIGIPPQEEPYRFTVMIDCCDSG